ncbi:MAG: Hsp20/alpha crystallin family protein [Gammaproteobacteria bacterium]|jgi:HSP20 family protein
MSTKTFLFATFLAGTLLIIPAVERAQKVSLLQVMLETAIPSSQAQQYGYPPPPPVYDPAPDRRPYVNPWIEMRRMEREMQRRQWQMDREMAQMEREMQQEQESSGIAIEESFSSPRIRIEENDDQFIVTAFIPGADGKTIEIEQRGNRLRIAAMRKVEKRETADGKRVQASFSSRYQRILTLPGPVRQGGMQTEFSDDVLTIRIPKAES